ncbi:adenine deaminase [Streptomyces spiroverticillatus]|uniref:Adenine deaminase n=1 Tax=Streptomyces finlayi TaxID=67296 RepID=A0A918WZ33_9ACTN|nr:adenine deaminase C-terminal domain-containing protein [Streptomyces finlayi]GHA15688.1 adenine deaminase [Streptomyces spiroverticillatus]GHC96583.1 adenine deaminase [Streptomyces finlayi]
MNLRQLIDASEGVVKADRVITGGTLVNVCTGEVYPADVAITGDRIAATGDVTAYIGEHTEIVDATGKHLVPGLIDGHLHLECSKLSPTMFADAVVRYGTTSVISGLDQILVVAGVDGVREALREAEQSPMKIFWGAPFKTPYTLPETTVGFNFGPAEHEETQDWADCYGVWETVAEFVLNRDPDVLRALELAHRNRLPVFGCAPMASSTTINALSAAGIRLDHESYTAEEALEKLRAGMYLLIRESSVAHFLNENVKTVTKFGAQSRRVGFCTDDMHVADILREGHLDKLVRMAIQAGVKPIEAIQMATVNCAEMYRIDHLVGSITPGRYADVLIIDSPESFQVERVFSRGVLAAENGRTVTAPAAPERSAALSPAFQVPELAASAIGIAAAGDSAEVLVVEMDRTVPFVRTRLDLTLPVKGGVVRADVAQDALYCTVSERYGKTGATATAMINGFGLRSGAIASSAAPDDNNIVCVGANREDMALAVNHLAAAGGGQIVVENGEIKEFLPLPVAGIVADIVPEEMAAAEDRLEAAARALGCELPSAFGYLIFLEITAIPDYAVTDLGVISYHTQSVVDTVLTSR